MVRTEVYRHILGLAPGYWRPSNQRALAIAYHIHPLSQWRRPRWLGGNTRDYVFVSFLSLRLLSSPNPEDVSPYTSDLLDKAVVTNVFLSPPCYVRSFYHS